MTHHQKEREGEQFLQVRNHYNTNKHLKSTKQSNNKIKHATLIIPKDTHTRLIKYTYHE